MFIRFNALDRFDLLHTMLKNTHNPPHPPHPDHAALNPCLFSYVRQTYAGWIRAGLQGVCGGGNLAAL